VSSLTLPSRRRARGALVVGQEIQGALSLEADVVIVGSGAGGAAAACELCEAGLDVIVCEEGGYVPTRDFSHSVSESLRRLYRDAGTNIILGEPGIVFSEGRTVGGSTVLNGGLAWRTPDRVLKRWQWEHGLPAGRFGPAAMAPVLERVERAIHVAPQNPDSIGENSFAVKRGCDALGYEAVPVRRSQRDCMGSNSCAFGCPTGAKQSTLVTYLPRAVAAGARLYADLRIERITVDRRGRATGVRGTVYNPLTTAHHPVSIRATTVISACGATQTPVLLLASGLGNRWVGRNLLVHPNAKVLGIFDEEIAAWKGVIQAFQIHEFLNEGLLMATSFLPPALLVMGLPLVGDELFELLRRDYNHMVAGGILIEDSTSGRVRRGPRGQALMTYDCTARDLQQILRGVALFSEVLFAAGARRVLVPIEGIEPLRTPDDIRRLYTERIRLSQVEMFTVHAMGTARLSATPESGAVDTNGELWGHAGVYVADASLFPGPIGINPQVTVMALATQVAWGIADRQVARRSH
jgi:choline dehydrogenase-like flavoprotein